jgi:hypothetical protein
MTDKRKRLFCSLTLAIWTALFTLSFVLFFTLEPTGDGFVRGFNRIGAFLTWQGFAFIVAIIAWLAGRGLSSETPGLRWLCRTPAIIQSLMVLLLIGVILLARFGSPAVAPGVAPGPVTAPVAAVPAAAPADVRQFNGFFRAGFESSHFYTTDGEGPWWLEANDADWQRLNESSTDGPGRSGGVTLALSVTGWLEDIGDELAHLGIDGYRLHVVTIDGMRVLSEEEFELVLDTVVR